MTLSNYETYLRADATLVNSLCLLCPLYSFGMLLNLLRIFIEVQCGKRKCATPENPKKLSCSQQYQAGIGLKMKVGPLSFKAIKRKFHSSQ